MPRTAIISDIHANLHALSAVIADVQAEQCTDIVCLGDIVGYNAFPSECLDYVRSLDCPVVKGNHDEEVVTPSNQNMNPVARQAMDWTRSQLNEDQLQWLGRLQYQRLVRSAFTMVHATMDQPKAWNYILNANDASSNFNRQFSQMCFHGHTHVPKIFFWDGQRAQEDSQALANLNREGRADFTPQEGVKYFINVGSVGQPRDNDVRACYCIYDSEANVLTFKRVEYDVASAQEAIRTAGLPEYLADRLGHGM